MLHVLALRDADRILRAASGRDIRGRRAALAGRGWVRLDPVQRKERPCNGVMVATANAPPAKHSVALVGWTAARKRRPRRHNIGVGCWLSSTTTSGISPQTSLLQCARAL